ncbi:MAG: hypothetical protein ACRERU_16080 [Methylococcales bacterium]
MFPVPSEKSCSADEYSAIERAAESKNYFLEAFWLIPMAIALELQRAGA